MVDPPLPLVAAFGITAALALLALLLVLSRKGRTEDQARAYLAGFTYVLSDDPDAAIAELSRAAQLDTQTVETYFALGALFRRKGELERAIRLHRNILLSPGVTPEVRKKALLALAGDYRRSGLVDKASETFDRLLAGDPQHIEGVEGLRRLFEEEKAWSKAWGLQERLCGGDGRGERVLAHLLSEDARSRLAEEGEPLARRAVEVYPACANAQLALGECLVKRGQGGAAEAPLRQAALLEPEVLTRRTRLYVDVLGEAGVAELLSSVGAARPDRTAALELSQAFLFKQRGRPDEALAVLRRSLERHPRHWEARKELGVLLLEQNRSSELRADYEELLGKLGEATTAFVCSGCRQRLPEHLFRCPSCEEWDSVQREIAPGG